MEDLRRFESMQHVTIGSIRLPGVLVIPSHATGLIVFAHDGAMRELCVRYQRVSKAWNQRGFATLQFGLLDENESRNKAKEFDISVLADRVLMAVRWVREKTTTRSLPIGLFGDGKGADAILTAASVHAECIGALVCCGVGRSGFEGNLAEMRVPCLLIVGGANKQVIASSEKILSNMTCQKALRVVPGVVDPFEVPGASERTISLAGNWFHQHLQLP